jgi:hypothetical protein
LESQATTDPHATDDLAEKVKDLPREVGALLLTFGVAGLILPGPIGTPAILAGGLVLWPGAFGRVTGWMRRRSPNAYRISMVQITRFVEDLEKRYPAPQKPSSSTATNHPNADPSDSENNPPPP